MNRALFRANAEDQGGKVGGYRHKGRKICPLREPESKQYILPELLYLSSSPHGVVTQNNNTDIFAAVTSYIIQ
jgi:hypothetical protein